LCLVFDARFPVDRGGDWLRCVSVRSERASEDVLTSQRKSKNIYILLIILFQQKKISWLFKVNVLDKSDFDVRKSQTRVNKKKR
jgi:hypothetical protein